MCLHPGERLPTEGAGRGVEGHESHARDGMHKVGEVAERFKAAVLKTVDPKGSGGSNPSLSAIFCVVVLRFSFLSGDLRFTRFFVHRVKQIAK